MKMVLIGLLLGVALMMGCAYTPEKVAKSLAVPELFKAVHYDNSTPVVLACSNYKYVTKNYSTEDGITFKIALFRGYTACDWGLDKTWYPLYENRSDTLCVRYEYEEGAAKFNITKSPMSNVNIPGDPNLVVYNGSGFYNVNTTLMNQMDRLAFCCKTDIFAKAHATMCPE